MTKVAKRAATEANKPLLMVSTPSIEPIWFWLIGSLPSTAGKRPDLRTLDMKSTSSRVKRPSITPLLLIGELSDGAESTRPSIMMAIRRLKPLSGWLAAVKASSFWAPTTVMVNDTAGAPILSIVLSARAKSSPSTSGKGCPAFSRAIKMSTSAISCEANQRSTAYSPSSAGN